VSFGPERVKDIPRLPGVYLMKDSQGRVIYVGKAKNLRARVRSYFREKGDGRPAVRFLLRNLEELEVVVTGSEKEALILENTFIKKHRPRYNVRFRDDKNYFHIRIDLNHPFPRLGLVRRPQRDGALYFGPYDSSHAVRETLLLLRRHMGLRTCKDSQFRLSRRTCLNQQMGRCAGVCRGAVSAEQYGLRIREAVLFLQGRSRELLKHLEARMKESAAALRFEEAARIRDQMGEVQRTLEAQRVDKPLGKDRDVVGMNRAGEGGLLLVLRVRGGKVWESLRFPLEPTPLEDSEVVESFLQQFYDEGRVPAPEILVPPLPKEEGLLLAQWLAEMVGHRVRIRHPVRGEARELWEMAQQNARLSPGDAGAGEEGLEGLARHLGLQRSPRVMEGFDISTLGGEEAVGSAVRFSRGRPARQAYRTYRIRSVAGVDDYAMMYELLQRHLRRRKGENDLPDLLVMDGGKGQLGVALEVIREQGLEDVEAVALAKGRRHGEGDGEEHVFLPGRKDGVSLRGAPDCLRLLQHLRDEAHRVAVGHHRRRRGKRRLASVLDGVPGIGSVRKKRLLQRFGSLQRIRQATVEELAMVPGIPLGVAERIVEALEGSREEREE
jgi:excinuclease ABC subunit C